MTLFADNSVDALKRASEGLSAVIGREQEKLERVNGLIAFFDNFTGWERFRDGYLKGVRMPQLQRECMKALEMDEKTRAMLKGQANEVEFLITGIDELNRIRQSLETVIADYRTKLEKVTRKIERKSGATA
jgi:hypothetical protein